MTRILIADDHQVVRSGLRAILEAQQNSEVVAEAADGKEAILKAIETKPDVAVLDYSLPLVNGIEATRQIRTRLPRTEVLVFTMHDNETVIGAIKCALALANASPHSVFACTCSLSLFTFLKLPTFPSVYF